MNNQKFYDIFSRLYPLVDVFLKPQKRVLADKLNSVTEGKLLEIGVGNGSHLNLYKKHHITGIDVSAAMLRVANKNLSNREVDLLQMDGQELTFNDHAFDYVVLSHVITVVDEPNKLLAEALRVLKPNGQMFILNHFTPDNWLKHIDSLSKSVSRRLHFRSVFDISDYNTITQFRLLKEIPVGFASYFKILIFEKLEK